MSVEERLAAALHESTRPDSQEAPGWGVDRMREWYGSPRELAVDIIRALADSGVVLVEREALATIRLALKGARGLALDHDATALDDELARAIELIDRMEPA